MSTRMEEDFERLSAYIDNELEPAEKAELEARLAKEPELQAGLNDLRRTVRALHALPTVKPPRSFALKPGQVGVRRGPLFPAFRLAAALCSLLLVVTLARDFVASSALTASPTTSFVVQNGAATNNADNSPTAEVLVVPNAAPVLTPTLGAESSGASGVAPTGTPLDDYGTTPLAHFNAVAPSPTPGATLKSLAPNPAQTATETPADTAVSIAAASAATASETPVANDGLQQPVPAAPPQPITGLRVAEVVLAVLALGLAAAAWFTRHG